MKRTVPIFAGLALGAALLWFAFRSADPRAITAALSAVRPAPLALILLTVAGELAIRGLKWSLLLAPARKVRAWDAARLETAALALNNLLPLRLGELARAAYGAELFNLSFSTVLATILAEKALDMAALAALSAAAAALGGAALNLPGWRLAAAAAAALALVIAAALYLAPGRGPKFKRTAQDLVLGLKALRTPGAAAGVLALALLQWLLNALNYYWLALAFGLEAAAAPARSVLLSFAGAAASSAPGMPGYFGSFELAVSAVLGAWGVPLETALAYAAAAHLLPYLIITAAGVFFIYGLGRSLGQVWARFSARSAYDIRYDIKDI